MNNVSVADPTETPTPQPPHVLYLWLIIVCVCGGGGGGVLFVNNVSETDPVCVYLCMYL